MQIKIESHTFDVEDLSVQFSLGSHASIYISIDTKKYPNYYKYFIKLSESSSKFDITSEGFSSYGSYIKSYDINIDKMNISIKSDIFEYKDKKTIRDEKLDDLLKLYKRK